MTKAVVDRLETVKVQYEQRSNTIFEAFEFGKEAPTISKTS